MVLPQQPQRRVRGPTNERQNAKAVSSCGRNHDDRGRFRTSRTTVTNAMTQTTEQTAKPSNRQETLSNVAHSPLANIHWSLATNSGLSRHKLPEYNSCLNASEKVQVACQAVEVSAASLHSLVECLQNLPMADREFGGTQRRSGGDASLPRYRVRPISTSSPVGDFKENKRGQSTPNVTMELALLLEKVRHLRLAAADADRELVALRAENAHLKRMQQRRSADSTLLKQQPLSPKQPPSPQAAPSPLAKYPNLRTLLLPATSSLLAESDGQKSEELPQVASESTSSADCFCDANSQRPSSATTLPASPFYSALQSTDDGLIRLRRHLANVQLLSSEQSNS